MKRCSLCGLEKPTTDYYRDKRTPSGLKAQCKKCHCRGSIATRDPDLHRVANRASMRALRVADPEKFRQRERIASQGRVRDERVHARALLNSAVRYGKIARPSECSKCHAHGKVTGHHPDYSRPLDVAWLCYVCHAAA